MIQSSWLSGRCSFLPPPSGCTLHILMWILSGECMKADGTMVDLQSELYFCASSQRNDCQVKSAMVKVNKQQLGYCVADWKGNYFVVQAGRCVCVCMYCFLCVFERDLRCSPVPCSFRWGFLLAASLPADLSVLVSLQGCEMTHHRDNLRPRNLFQLFPSHCWSLCSVLFPSPLYFFSLLYIHSPHLILLLFSLCHVGRISCFLSFLQIVNDSCLDPVCKASIRIT